MRVFLIKPFFKVDRADGAAGHIAELATGLVHHAKPGGAQAGVDTKNSHAGMIAGAVCAIGSCLPQASAGIRLSACSKSKS